MDERLKQQLEFALEIDKEKNIFRQTHLSGHGRNAGIRCKRTFLFFQFCLEGFDGT